MVDYSAVGREIAIGERFAVKRRTGPFFRFRIMIFCCDESDVWDETGNDREIYGYNPFVMNFHRWFLSVHESLKSCPCHLSYDSLDMLPARIWWASEREETQGVFFNIWSYRFDRSSLTGFCLDQVAWTCYSWWFMNLLNEISPHPALLSGRHFMEPSVLYGGQSVL